MTVANTKKQRPVQDLINSAFKIIEAVGVPTDDLSKRAKERTSMAVLALGGITLASGFSSCQSIKDQRYLRTKEVIVFHNGHLEERISSGSYDDIRRKDLVRLVGMGLVVNSAKNPEADINDGTRGYALNEDFARLIRTFGTELWSPSLQEFGIDEEYLALFLSERKPTKIQVKLSDSINIELLDGPHNQLQKAIIEEFLQIFGEGAEVLYIGDTSNKSLHQYDDRMVELGIDLQDRGMLPDIVAFSESREWLYLVEAVHSSNPLNPERVIDLKRNALKYCNYGVVFVTAFLTKRDFAKWMTKIAWETEVWIAESPTHMVHFNGDKFLGPHNDDPY